MDPRATAPGLMSVSPWVMYGMTYATDRRCCIRFPGEPEGYERITPDDRDGKRRDFANVALRTFKFFENGDHKMFPLVCLSTLNLEPVLVRRMAFPSGIDWENPAMNEAQEFFVAACSPVEIGRRRFCAKRLLFIRQTLPNVAFCDQQTAEPTVPLHFVFGDNHEGHGVLCGLKDDGRPGHLHWNGARYFPSW